MPPTPRPAYLAEAERLFATRGFFVATTREITEATGQRGTLALTYHFGSARASCGPSSARAQPALDDLRAAPGRRAARGHGRTGR